MTGNARALGGRISISAGRLGRYAVMPLLVLVLTAGAAVAQTKYRIKFDRPKRLTDIRSLEGSSTKHQIMRLASGESTLREADSTFTYILAADVRAGKDDNEVTLVVRRCVRYAEGDTTEILAPGATLKYRSVGGRWKLHANGADVDEDVVDELNKTIVNLGFGRTDADVGTKASIPVGGTWKVDAAGKMAGVNDNDVIKLNLRETKGRGTLVSVSTSGAEPSMRLRLDIHMGSFTLPAQKNMRITSSNLDMTYTGDYPLDEREGMTAVAMVTNFAMKAKMQTREDQPALDLETHGTLESRTTFTYR